MKRNYKSILFATALALLALLISQALWLRYASKQDSYKQDIAFVTCFNQAISSTIRDNMEVENRVPFTTIEPIDSVSLEGLLKDKDKKIRIADAGDIKEGVNVALTIENALIVLKIKEEKLNLAVLDSLIINCINGKEKNVVSSHIVLQDTKENRVLDEVQQEYISTNNLFFVKTYTAERVIEIPSNSYLIEAEYRIKQPSYLKRLGIVTLTSIIASIIIVSVLFYLLLIINRRYAEISRMERSFHGAIHDLKSPLAYVYFTLSSMEEDELDMGKKTALSQSANRVLFLSNKIQRLLKSSQNIQKIEEADKKEVLLYDMLEQIEEEIRTMYADKSIRFENKVDADYTLMVLPDLMEASIRIIIENAVKYSDSNPNVEITAIRNVSDLKIFITDKGIGINAKQLKNIFKPYYSSDKMQGNGIGLYYAQSIVKAHGGNISVTSEEGKGSTFVITIPNR